MPEVWPSQFQQLLDRDSFNYKIGPTVLRSDMGIGPAKVRRLVTKSVDTLSCSIVLEFDLYQDFVDFFDITLNGGINTFYFDHPFTGVQEVFRFSEAPNFTPLGGRQFKVKMVWEKLP
jgi:hypothetical protein